MSAPKNGHRFAGQSVAFKIQTGDGASPIPARGRTGTVHRVAHLHPRRNRRGRHSCPLAAVMSKLKGVVSHHAREVAELGGTVISRWNTSRSPWSRSTIRRTAPPACWRCAPSRKPMVDLAHGGRRSRDQPQIALPALSPKGNPTLKTLLAVLKTLGLRLSVRRRTRGLTASPRQVHTPHSRDVLRSPCDRVTELHGGFKFRSEHPVGPIV